LISIVVLMSGCSRFAQRGESFQQVKIVRVIGNTSLEVLYKGKMIVIDLEGVFFPEEETLEVDYFESKKIEPRFRDKIYLEYSHAHNYLSTLIAPGDLLFVEKFINEDIKMQKMSGVILYSSDMISVNEKLVSAGYAFPKKKSEIRDSKFAFQLHRALKMSVNKRVGLWPIGQYLLDRYTLDGDISTGITPQPARDKEVITDSSQKDEPVSGVGKE